MGKEAALRRYGSAMVEISVEQLRRMLTVGWSTGNRSLVCTSGIPANAQFTSVTFVRPDTARLYFRSQDLPDVDCARCDVIYQQVDVEALTAGACLLAIQKQLQSVPLAPRRSRLASWLGRAGAYDAGHAGIRAGLTSAMQSISLAFPNASAGRDALLAATTAPTKQKDTRGSQG